MRQGVLLERAARLRRRVSGRRTKVEVAISHEPALQGCPDLLVNLRDRERLRLALCGRVEDRAVRLRRHGQQVGGWRLGLLRQHRQEFLRPGRPEEVDEVDLGLGDLPSQPAGELLLLGAQHRGGEQGRQERIVAHLEQAAPLVGVGHGRPRVADLHQPRLLVEPEARAVIANGPQPRRIDELEQARRGRRRRARAHHEARFLVRDRHQQARIDAGQIGRADNRLDELVLQPHRAERIRVRLESNGSVIVSDP